MRIVNANLIHSFSQSYSLKALKFQCYYTLEIVNDAPTQLLIHPSSKQSHKPKQAI